MDEQQTATVRKTYQYKLQPTAEQERTLAFVLRRCRELSNAGLQERRDAWQKGGVSITAARQSAHLPAIKDVRPEYREVHAQVLQDVLTRLDRAFEAFFRRVRAGETPGYPRFHGANRYHSCTSKQLGNGATRAHGVLVLSKLRRVAVRWSRPLEGTPKTVTISRAADGWYACFSGEGVPIQPLPARGQETGIDLGLESFATLANGEPLANPRIVGVAERRVRRAQRRMTRRGKGSQRRRKAVRLLARAQQQVRRTRVDFHHKTAFGLVRAYAPLSHDELQTANLLRNHHLATSIADAGWSAFLGILSCKAVEAGKTVIAVPPAFTSHACSGCGVLVYTGLSVRWHACADCGTSLQRDHNAALTILRLGRQRRGLGQSPQARTWAGGPSVA
jgi:putative transposase